MKNIFHKLFLLCSLLVWAGCEKDGEMITVSDLEDTNLVASLKNVVLTKEKSNAIALSIAWTPQTITISNPNMGISNLLSTYLVVSLSEDLSDGVESLEESHSRAYTGAELNTIAKNLGAEPDEATPVYFALKSYLGANMEPVYSNVETVKVTAYHIDMTRGFILDKDGVFTDNFLYSEAADGNYKGFVGAVAWYNFFLKEGDDTVWGNVGEDGNEFRITNDASSWNMWYPGFGGCYYTELNTTTKLWSALYIPQLTVSGGISGEMTYDRANNRWMLPFSSNASEISIRLTGEGKQYNFDSGTTDDAAVTTPVGFGGTASNLLFGTQASDLTLSVPAGGEYTLMVDLSNPLQFVCTVSSGSEEPEEISKNLWLSGIDDGISGGWTFDNYLVLYDEEKLGYAGAVNVNSLWGYKFYTEQDWSSALGFVDGTAESGTFSAESGENIPAPEEGLWLFDVSMKAMSYNLVAIETVSYAGFHDDWTMIEMTETSVPGVYTSDLEIRFGSPWGFKLYVNGSWDHFFGGNEGNLYYQGQGITDDASVAPGNYTLVVDLTKGTYTLQ